MLEKYQTKNSQKTESRLAIFNLTKLLINAPFSSKSYQLNGPNFGTSDGIAVSRCSGGHLATMLVDHCFHLKWYCGGARITIVGRSD